MVPAGLPKPENIRALAARLAGHGYHVVPIPRGHKGPVIPGWDKLRLTPADTSSYFSETGMLIGVLHDNLAAFDIDVTDPDLAARIVAEAARRFPGALERIGNAPKSAIVLRLDEPFRIPNTAKRERVDAATGEVFTAQVEVRTATRQMVAYGLHPDTGRPYTWPRGELWDTPRAGLPALAQADAQAFRDWCEAEINAWAGGPAAAPRSNIIDLGEYRGDGIALDAPPSEQSFLKALRHVPPSLGHEAGWCAALMAIHDFYSGSAAGLSVAKDWSSADSRYKPHEVEAKWRSFEVGKGVSYKTIFGLARQHGCDLSALAREERAGQANYASPDALAQPTDAPTSGAIDAPPAPAGLEWFDEIEPSLAAAYMVKGVLDAGAMSVIYGPSNSGKTFFALDLAFHVASGERWRGRRVTQAAVLYLAAEGGRGVLNRVAALKVANDDGVVGTPLAIRRAGLDLLRDQADLQHIADLAAQVQARLPGAPLLIVIDTLSRIMAGGDENSAADMTALIRNIDGIRELTGAHIMLVHHTGKDAAKGARGHSSLRAATDTEIEVSNDGGARAAFVTKQRDNPGGETFAFSLRNVALGIDQDGDDVSSCVVEALDDEASAARKAAKGVGGNQKIVLDTFDQMIAEGLGRPNPGGVGLPEPGRFMCVPADDLRRHCEGKFTAVKPRNAWSDAFAALRTDRGLVCMAEGLVWRTDRKMKS